MSEIEVGVYHITIPREHGFVSYVKLPEWKAALTSWGKTPTECKEATVEDLARFDYKPIFREYYEN